MPRSLSWSKILECRAETEFIERRWKDFCCSVVRGVRPCVCSICPGDHEMVERHLHCKRETCENSAGLGKCPVRWKVRHCPSASIWIVLSNGACHLRGDIGCAVPPRSQVTSEMKAFIHRMDENAVPPRLIWSNLLRAPDIPKPVLGYPSYAQVQRSVSYLRRVQGSKNSIQRVQELVRSKAFLADIDPGAAFVFGDMEDSGGFPFVRNGEDDQPLILGITTLMLLRGIVALQRNEPFLIFHLDATFKLSDLGYPVITCGFTDKRHLAALFIVSQRSEREYYVAIGTFVKVFQTHMKTPLRIDAVMGDAEAAQVNGLGKIASFSGFKYLNVLFSRVVHFRKRIRHLIDPLGALVYRGILDMHYTQSDEDVILVGTRVMKGWQQEPHLRDFMNYFYTQWLQSRFWRWQIYHSPGGFATTNNPCEVFNASIKGYTLRKAVNTRRLILKLLTIVEDYSICAPPPPPSGVISAPPQEAKKLAKVLVSTQRIAVFSTHDSPTVRVKYLGDRERDNEDIDNISGIADSRTIETPPATQSFDATKWLTDAEKKSASTFYRSAVKWSVRRAHHIGMPQGGWLVDTNTFECACAFFTKFLSSAHVICGRMALGLSMPGVGGQHLKFKDRRVRRARGATPKRSRLSITRCFDERNLQLESESPFMSGLINPFGSESNSSSLGLELASSSVQAFLHELPVERESDRYESPTAEAENSYGISDNNHYQLASLSNESTGVSGYSYLTRAVISSSFGEGVGFGNGLQYELTGSPTLQQQFVPRTNTSTSSVFSRINIASLLSPEVRSSAIDHHPAEEEGLRIRRPSGRPPLASSALDIQYLLR